MTQVPKERCELKTFKMCTNESISLPSLELVNECVDVPKEICSMERVNPRQVARPVVKLWCNDTIGEMNAERQKNWLRPLTRFFCSVSFMSGY